jgi:predicted ATPase
MASHVHVRKAVVMFNICAPASDICMCACRQHSEPSAGMLMLAGDRGSGKSSLTVTWVEEMTSQHPNTRLVTYFCESSAEHRTLTFLLQEVTIALRRLAGQQGGWVLLL